MIILFFFFLLDNLLEFYSTDPNLFSRMQDEYTIQILNNIHIINFNKSLNLFYFHRNLIAFFLIYKKCNRLRFSKNYNLLFFYRPLDSKYLNKDKKYFLCPDKMQTSTVGSTDKCLIQPIYAGILYI